MLEPRSITPDDLHGTVELLDDVFRRGNQVRDQDVLTDFPLFFAPANHGNSRVIVADGRIVSHAGIFPCQANVNGVRLKMAVILLVATHPDYRNRGCAARLMRDLRRTMHEESYDLGILWTDVPDFYRKLGWEVVTPRGWLLDDLRAKRHVVERVARDLGPRDVVRPYDAEKHLDGIIKLHDREPISIARSSAEYRALLNLPKIGVWVLERDGAVATYLVVAQGHNKRGLIEYAGSAEDIVSLASHVLHNEQLDRELPLLIHHVRPDLAQLFQHAGESLAPLECSKGRGCEMIYIAQPDRFPAAVRNELFIWGLDVT